MLVVAVVVCRSRQRQILSDQSVMWGHNGYFARVCDAVKRFSGGKRGETMFAREELSKIKPLLPQVSEVPFDCRVRLGELLVDECKVMGSAKRPLWLVFRNADPLGAKVIIMFKAGDDLRQDCVTLQVCVQGVCIGAGVLSCYQCR
jgi:hypothetical protein